MNSRTVRLKFIRALVGRRGADPWSARQLGALRLPLRLPACKRRTARVHRQGDSDQASILAAARRIALYPVRYGGQPAPA
eukprot:1193556-Prorocentrum_minimum.AAC.3